MSILVAGNEIYQFIRGLTADYPDNDINGYIAWAAGGATDTTSRGISMQAQKFLGTNIVMQNKTGATGAIATEFVSRLPADGYSLLYNAENPTLYHVMDISNVDYEEFYPVLLFGSQVPVVIVPPNSKYQSIKEVIEDAAANPGKISLGISGVGGLPYNVSCMLQSTSNVQFNQVPFDGDSSIISALLGGHVDLSVVNYSTAADLYKTGDLRILTVLNNDRKLIALDVTCDGTCTHVGLISEDGVADIVIMRNLYAVEKNNVLQLGGVTDYAAFTDESGTTYERALTHFCLVTDDARSADISGSEYFGIFCDPDILSRMIEFIFRKSFSDLEDQVSNSGECFPGISELGKIVLYLRICLCKIIKVINRIHYFFTSTRWPLFSIAAMMASTCFSHSSIEPASDITRSTGSVPLFLRRTRPSSPSSLVQAST